MVGNEVYYAYAMYRKNSKPLELSTTDKAGLHPVQDAIKQLEGIVHPLVAAHRHNFLQHLADATDQRLIVLDIPLLFEVHGEDQVA